MTLEVEIKKARQTIVSDGYDMSVGEVMNLYQDSELMIAPSFQRLFRWDVFRKSRFIESLLLGIPIPPIFVYQAEDGIWELIDGLQRLSTILEFAGKLQNTDPTSTAEYLPPSTLCGTKLLPSLQDKKWESKRSEKAIGKNQQIQIKRARIRVEILKAQSDSNAKFELFQRLNTGGAVLSPQEVRNCVAVMVNKDFYAWLIERANYRPFMKTISQTPIALERQSAAELALRFFSYRNIPYDGRMNVHEYLDDALLQLANSTTIDWNAEKECFERSFDLLYKTFGKDAFKRWDGDKLKGSFLKSVFEAVGHGVSHNLDSIEKQDDPAKFLKDKSKSLWSNKTFNNNSGAGIRGTQRLTKLLPFAQGFFTP